MTTPVAPDVLGRTASVAGVQLGQAGGEQAMGRAPAPSVWDDESCEPEPRRWTAPEVAELLARYPRLTPLRIVVVQALVGIALALMGWVLTDKLGVARSVLYGAAVAVVPGALLAFGLRRQTQTATGAQWRFVLWWFAKLGMACAMLVGATRVVPDLSWPALLLGLVVCLKVYAWALLSQRRVKKNA